MLSVESLCTSYLDYPDDPALEHLVALEVQDPQAAKLKADKRVQGLQKKVDRLKAESNQTDWGATSAKISVGAGVVGGLTSLYTIITALKNIRHPGDSLKAAFTAHAGEWKARITGALNDGKIFSWLEKSPSVAEIGLNEARGVFMKAANLKGRAYLLLFAAGMFAISVLSGAISILIGIIHGVGAAIRKITGRDKQEV